MSYADQMELFWAKASDQHENQVRRIIASMSENEGNPDDPNDALKLLGACQEFIQTCYPDRQCLICIQRDGKTGHLHAHCILNDCDMLNAKGCSLDQQKFWFVEKHFDEIAKKYIGELDCGQNKVRGRKSLFERAVSQDEIKKPSWKDDLRNRIMSVTEVAIDWQDYCDRLEKKGVQAVYHENSGKYDDYITYELVDCDKYRKDDGTLPGNNKWLRSKHHKLFKATELEKIKDLYEEFEKNRNEIAAQYGSVAVDDDFDETISESAENDLIDENDSDDDGDGDSGNGNGSGYTSLFNLKNWQNGKSTQYQEVITEINHSSIEKPTPEGDIAPIMDKILHEDQTEPSDVKKEIIEHNNDYIAAIVAEGLRLDEELNANDITKKLQDLIEKDGNA